MKEATLGWLYVLLVFLTDLVEGHEKNKTPIRMHQICDQVVIVDSHNQLRFS